MAKKFSTSYPIRFLIWVVFTVFIRSFGIRKKLPPEVKNQKSPYLLLSNHVGHWDPFIIGNMLPRFTHFVSSDMAFTGRINSFFLPRLGTIPKKKNVRDARVIRDIAAVIRQGENVGLFPEAVRNWAGVTQPIDPSIAKLIKFLKVPVITSVMRGMNLFNPRWSRNLRPTRVEVEYQLLLDTDDIAEMTEEKIFESLHNALAHDETNYQLEHRNVIKSERRAEHISHAIFVCPDCHAIDSFRCHRNDFHCSGCNYHLHIDKYGFYEMKSGNQLHFDNIRGWFDWQKKWLMDFVKMKWSDHDEQPLFQDFGSKVFFSDSRSIFEFVGIADISFFKDRVSIDYHHGEEHIDLCFEDMQTINPQLNERLEIQYNGEMYRIEGGRKGVSGLKWEIAANAVWEKMGQHHKLSPYL